MFPLDIWINVVSHLGMRDAISLSNTHSLLRSCLDFTRVLPSLDMDGYLVWACLNASLEQWKVFISRYSQPSSSTLIKATVRLLKADMHNKDMFDRFTILLKCMDVTRMVSLLHTAAQDVPFHWIQECLVVDYQDKTGRMGHVPPSVRLKYCWSYLPPHHLMSLLQQPDYSFFFIQNVRYLIPLISTRDIHPFIQQALEGATVSLLHQYDPQGHDRHQLARLAMDQNMSVFESVMKAGWVDTTLHKNALVDHALTTQNKRAFHILVTSMQNTLSHKEFQLWILQVVQTVLSHGDDYDSLQWLLRHGLDPRSLSYYPWVLSYVLQRRTCTTLLACHPNMIFGLTLLTRKQHRRVIQCCTDLVQQSWSLFEHLLQCILSKGDVALIHSLFHSSVQQYLHSVQLNEHHLTQQPLLHSLLHHPVSVIQDYYQHQVDQTLLHVCRSRHVTSLKLLVQDMTWEIDQVKKLVLLNVEWKQQACLDVLFEQEDFQRVLAEWTDFPVTYESCLLSLINMGIHHCLDPWVTQCLEWNTLLERAVTQRHVHLVWDILDKTSISCITMQAVYACCTWKDLDVVQALLSHPKLIIHNQAVTQFYQSLLDPSYDSESLVRVLQRLALRTIDWNRIIETLVESIHRYILLEYIVQFHPETFDYDTCLEAAKKCGNDMALQLLNSGRIV